MTYLTPKEVYKKTYRRRLRLVCRSVYRPIARIDCNPSDERSDYQFRKLAGLSKAVHRRWWASVSVARRSYERFNLAEEQLPKFFDNVWSCSPFMLPYPPAWPSHRRYDIPWRCGFILCPYCYARHLSKWLWTIRYWFKDRTSRDFQLVLVRFHFDDPEPWAYFEASHIVNLEEARENIAAIRLKLGRYISKRFSRPCPLGYLGHIRAIPWYSPRQYNFPAFGYFRITFSYLILTKKDAILPGPDSVMSRYVPDCVPYNSTIDVMKLGQLDSAFHQLFRYPTSLLYLRSRGGRDRLLRTSLLLHNMPLWSSSGLFQPIPMKEVFDAKQHAMDCEHPAETG